MGVVVVDTWERRGIYFFGYCGRVRLHLATDFLCGLFEVPLATDLRLHGCARGALVGAALLLCGLGDRLGDWVALLNHLGWGSVVVVEGRFGGVETG